MGFVLSITGPCRDCMDAEILVRRSRRWIGEDISVPVYKVWCKHEKDIHGEYDNVFVPYSNLEALVFYFNEPKGET